MINVVKNFLYQDQIGSILQDFESKKSTASFEINNLGRWGAGLDNGSYGPVYIFPLESYRESIKSRFDHIDPVFGEYNLNVCYLHIWNRGSQITWHHDAPAEQRRLSATIYLNRYWDRDWGGLFLYQDNQMRNSWIHPEYNTVVWFRPPLWHAVSMIGLNATEPRLSIQCFFDPKDGVQAKTAY